MGSVSPQVVDYLTRQLARNPIHESSDIVAARARAFKLKAKTPPAADTSPSGERQQVRDQLESIRKQCFSAPIPQLTSQLDQLKLDEFPDLAALGKRLKVILATRGKLPALSQNPNFDGDFFSCLKQVLVSPSRDVSVLREQVLSSFRHRRNRRRGQAMIRLIKDELPELYALEAAWFDSLIHYKANKHYGGTIQRTQAGQSQESSGSKHWWLLLLLILPLIRAGQTIHEAMNEQPRDRSSQYERPNRSYVRPTIPKPLDENRFDATPSANAAQEAFQRMEEHRRQHRERIDEMRRGRFPSDSIVPDFRDRFQGPGRTTGPGDSVWDEYPSSSPAPAPSPYRP